MVMLEISCTTTSSTPGTSPRSRISSAISRALASSCASRARRNTGDGPCSSLTATVVAAGLASNGDLVNKILRAGNNHEKEYLVTVDKPVTREFVEGMSNGVPILGTMTKRCKVEKVSRFVFRITLVQGLNRQIRRMAEYFGYEVTRLERVRIMNVSLQGLPVGAWRDLTEKELAVLFDAIRDSSSEATEPAGSKPRKKPAGARGARPGPGGKPARAGAKAGGKSPAGKGRKGPGSGPGKRPSGKPGGGPKPGGRGPGSKGKPSKPGKPRKPSIKKR